MAPQFFSEWKSACREERLMENSLQRSGSLSCSQIWNSMYCMIRSRRLCLVDCFSGESFGIAETGTAFSGWLRIHVIRNNSRKSMISCCEAKGVSALIFTCSMLGRCIGVENVFFPSDMICEIRERSSLVRV